MNQLDASHNPKTYNLRWLLLAIATAVAFRYLCFAVMTVVAVWHESRPAGPMLPDLIMDHVSTQEWVYRVNLWAWFLGYVPGGLLLLALRPLRFVRWTVSCGLLSLLRALCIPLTSLGPLNGPDAHAGMSLARQWEAMVNILNPLAALMPRSSTQEVLTKDLFFSGHTATTFLLLLYVWPLKSLRWFVLAGHVMVMVVLVFSRLHYSIDIVAAYAFSFVIFTLREGKPRAGLTSADLGPSWGAARSED